MTDQIGGSAIQTPDSEEVEEEQIDHNDQEPLESTFEQTQALIQKQTQEAQDLVQAVHGEQSQEEQASPATIKSELLTTIGELNQERKEAETILSQKKTNLEKAHQEYTEARNHIEDIETKILYLTKRVLNDVMTSKEERANYEQELPSDTL